MGDQDTTGGSRAQPSRGDRPWRLPRTARGWAATAGAILLAAALLWVAGVWALGADDEPADRGAAAPPSAAPTASALGEATCTADVEVREQWEGGFTADVVVRTGERGLDTWTVTLDLGEATVDGAWNSTLERGDSGEVQAEGVDHNRAVAPQAEARFGFTARGNPDGLAATCAGVGSDEPPARSAGEAPEGEVAPPVNPPSGDDWLSVDGNRLVDAQGRQVWLTGANWFGFNTADRVLHGLWTVNLEGTVASLAERGINVLRIPVSTEVLLEWRAGEATVPSNVNVAANPDLEGATTLDVFDALLVTARANGVKLIVDVHSAKADNLGHNAPLWTAPGITTEDFMVGWEWLAERSRDDDTIVGFDLQNEPHGAPPNRPRATWGDGSATDWRAVASEAAQRIHEVHPDALLIVEGIEATPTDGASWSSDDPGDYDVTWWGGNLSLAGALPVDGPADKIMYSPHDYGPLVYEQPWFQGEFSARSLERDVWGPFWLYLHDDGRSPLLIGEWGGRLGEDGRQDRWMEHLRDLIVDRGLHHTFWALNPNSADTGGLLTDDWTTWDEQKYALLEPALWQDGQGRFVGLDHEIPLPGGITVTEHYDAGGEAPRR